VRALRATRDGDLWIGSRGGGSYRLHAGHCTRLQMRGGLPDDQVLSFTEDADGTLWIGSYGGGMARLRNGVAEPFHPTEGTIDSLINVIHRDRNGTLWVGTDEGLFRLRDGRVTRLPSRAGTSSQVVDAIFEDREGSLWIGTWRGGLERLRDSKFTAYGPAQGLASRVVHSVVQDPDGSFWIGTEDGLNRFHQGRFSVVSLDIPPLTEAEVDDLYRDSRGNLWLPSPSGPRRLSGANVRDVLRDRRGDVWVATYTGLVRFSGGRTRTLTTRDGLANNQVRVLLEDRSGDLWIGTRNGLDRYHAGQFAHFTERDGLSSDFILSLHQDRAGRIWIGTDGGGLYVYDGQRFQNFTTRDGLTSDVVFRIHEDARGDLWIATNGGVTLRHDGRFFGLTTRHGIPADVVFQVLEDDHGSLWLTGSTQLARVSKAEMLEVASGQRATVTPELFTRSDGLPAKEPTPVSRAWKARDGTLWFPTLGGVGVIDPARIPRNAVVPPVAVEEVRVDGRPAEVENGVFTVRPGWRRLEFRYTALSFLAPDRMRFRYQLVGYDSTWADGGASRSVEYTNLRPGHYTFRVVGSNNDGVWNLRGAAISLQVRPRVYQTWWFRVLAALAVIAAALAIYRLRVRRLEREVRVARERAETLEALDRSEERYQALYEESPSLHLTLTPQGEIVSANPFAATLLDRPDLTGMLLPELIQEEDLAETVRQLMACARDLGQLHQWQMRRTRVDGSVLWLEAFARALPGPDGSPRILLVGQNITERKRAEDQLQRDSLYDRLTGLPNRALFTDRLHFAIARGRRRGSLFAVAFLDVDRFKVINDSLGHDLGDQLLIELGQRIVCGVREGDTVARFAADEFTVLLEDLRDPEDATRIMEQIQRAIEVPFELGGQEIFAAVSIGIALSTTEWERAEDLLRNADNALHQAKARGRARFEVFDSAMHRQVLGQLRLETDLRKALERQELRAHYQPIVRVDTGQIVGFETLVRWMHPARGLMPPSTFIPLAEETGLIVAIGRWVLNEACRQARDWQVRHPQIPLRVGVNISSKQFTQTDLVEEVRRALQESGLDARSLHLEITESVIMDNAQSSIATLWALRELGAQLSLDDFGTGYSSLSYLHRFPIDVLKIDRSFVSRVEQGGRDAEIVRSVIALGQSLGMSVIAEGIETAAQRGALRDLHCEFGQGYLFSPPVEAAAAEQLFAPQSLVRPLSA
jgi:diguanylate cyclase (GGDEF)-like protein/PAS domain S-box-containing protein